MTSEVLHILIAVAFTVLGLVTFALAKGDSKEGGRITFFVGLLWFVYLLVHAHV